jgi:hypothetical protein
MLTYQIIYKNAYVSFHKKSLKALRMWTLKFIYALIKVALTMDRSKQKEDTI